jgi:hypothetical protein
MPNFSNEFPLTTFQKFGLLNCACLLGIFLLPAFATAQTTTVLTAVDDPTSGRYCASTNGDATVVDALDNDINAEVVATTSAPGKVTSIRADGNFAYMGGYRFKVYDISDPANPTETASLRYTGGNDGDQQIRDIRVDGNQVYVNDSTAPEGDDTGSTVYSIDVSDKSNPTVDDYVSFESGYYEEIWGSESLAQKGDHLFAVDPNPGDLRSINKSNPSDLTVSTSSALSEVPIGHDCRLANNTCEYDFGTDDVFKVKEVRLSGDYAYTVYDVDPGKVRIFDISNPNNMQQVGTTTVASNSETVAVTSNRLFVGADAGVLEVYDRTNPANPSKLGEINLMDSESDITSLYVNEDIVYVTLSNIGTGDDPAPNDLGGVMAVDVSEPANPKALWGIELGNSPERVIRHNDLLYVADSGEASDSTESLMYVIDPDAGYKEINSYTQPSNGTVSVDDNDTPDDETDDKFSYYPIATGTDSFEYDIVGEDASDADSSATATVAFDVQEDQCDTGDISVSADPSDITLHAGSSTLSWSYDDVSDCDTQDGTSEWRNIDPMADADCLNDGEDSSCSGSDSADITDIDSDTTFTLACDTANDGDDLTDTSTSTDVTVTDLTACPFVEGNGNDEYDHVIILDQYLSANGPATGDSITKNLPADQFDLAFWGYDDARGSDYNRSAQNQPMEKWFLRFSNSNGYASSTASTDDLPDDSQLGTSTDYMTISLSE